MADEKGPKKLGTFAGVFTPSILTILGVIMYLRMGGLVGEVGLIQMILIILVATTITFITGLSIAAIATNMDIKAGGAYYMLSRSFGVEMGASIGIPLYIAQTLSITLYVLGFSESFMVIGNYLVDKLPEGIAVIIAPWVTIKIVAIIIIIAVLGLAFIGITKAIFVQYIIMGLIAISLVIFAATANYTGSGGLVLVGNSGFAGFGPAFSLFFPAVTGILAGVSLSGDLKKPEKSLPRGTISAVLVGGAVYLVLAVLFAVGVSEDSLLNDGGMVMINSAGGFPGLGILILFGIWGATISSAIGSILGAPRTLQAMAKDDLVPSKQLNSFIAFMPKGRTEPVVALLISFLIAFVATVIADLNVIADILTMFFLATYGMINLAAGLEKLIGNPSYRPKFNVPWFVSLIGAAACFIVMIYLNVVFALIAIAVIALIYFLVKRRKLKAQWGDIRRGFWLYLVRLGIMNLKAQPMDRRNWRPILLAFVTLDKTGEDLVDFAYWLSNKDIVTFCHLVYGDVEQEAEKRRKKLKELNALVSRRSFVNFPEVDVVKDFSSGVALVAQANGIAGIESNTILMGWPNRDNWRPFGKVLRTLDGIKKSMLILHPNYVEDVYERTFRIDVWWSMGDDESDLKFLLAYLITLNDEWKDHRIVLHTAVMNAGQKRKMTKVLEHAIIESHLDTVRYEIHTINKISEYMDLVQQVSHDAELVMFEFQVPDEEHEMIFLDKLEDRLKKLPTSILVRSNRLFELARQRDKD